MKEVDIFSSIIDTKLKNLYKDYTYENFKECLSKVELFEMDIPNKKVGIAKKFWWQEHIGRISGADILEVGCGVNYLVPYWIDAGNFVTAFDICKESVILLRSIMKQIGLDNDRLDLFVGNAEKVVFNKKFDIINVNNVLHHISDKEAVLIRLKECLKDEGRLMITEPNYYYPFRWIIETDIFDPYNIVRNYLIKNSYIEKNEKGVVFKALKETLRRAGFRIEFNHKDNNYLGYGITSFIDKNKLIPKILFNMDKHLLSHLLPSVLAPFEYLILTKEK